MEIVAFTVTVTVSLLTAPWVSVTVSLNTRVCCCELEGATKDTIVPLISEIVTAGPETCSHLYEAMPLSESEMLADRMTVCAPDATLSPFVVITGATFGVEGVLGVEGVDGVELSPPPQAANSNGAAISVAVLIMFMVPSL
ncbi:hypothetical protein VIBNIFTn2_420006 [Vibrio nigripulchritudo FTn2]|nr:hypothetical protein VIBNIAM115_1200006 [Vibrio nigripulchritudo AM115]CCN42871.1 hypothetical protein VIBNIFTn2_420006 [Vibrio nigripulchritudo FTn2]